MPRSTSHRGHIVIEIKSVIFQNHLRPLPSNCGSLIKQLQQTTPIIRSSSLTDKQWKLLQAVNLIPDKRSNKE